MNKSSTGLWNSFSWEETEFCSSAACAVPQHNVRGNSAEREEVSCQSCALGLWAQQTQGNSEAIRLAEQKTLAHCLVAQIVTPLDPPHPQQNPLGGCYVERSNQQKAQGD